MPAQGFYVYLLEGSPFTKTSVGGAIYRIFGESGLLENENQNGTRRAGTHHTAAVKNRHRENYPRVKGLRVGVGSGSQSLRLIMCARYPS